MRCALALGVGLVACGDDRPARTVASITERTIERQLGERVGAKVTVVCKAARCTAGLADGTTLPIALSPDGAWRLDGLLVLANELEGYLAQAVADLGAPQHVRCVPPVRVVAAGDRIACDLERGGVAFVTVEADGSTSIEIALDAYVGAARTIELPPGELERKSRELADDDAGDEADDDRE